MTDYKQKYLKYKHKYIELKQVLHGGKYLSLTIDKLQDYIQKKTPKHVQEAINDLNKLQDYIQQNTPKHVQEAINDLNILNSYNNFKTLEKQRINSYLEKHPKYINVEILPSYIQQKVNEIYNKYSNVQPND